MSDGILKDTLEVDVDGEKFVFAIPSFADEIRLGLRERHIRRTLETEMAADGIMATGDATGDNATEFLVRTAAQFAHLLRQGPQWVWSANETGQPRADFKNWPLDKVDTALRVGVEYQNALARFRAGGTPNGNAAGAKVVVGEPDTSLQSVSP